MAIYNIHFIPKKGRMWSYHFEYPIVSGFLMLQVDVVFTLSYKSSPVTKGNII